MPFCEAIETARSAALAYAKFQKTVSHVDLIETFMAVPNEWLGTLLPNLGPNTIEPIQVMDERINKMYTFLLRKRPVLIKDDQPYSLKPVFESQAWIEFVRENGLRSGDTLYFWKEGGRSDENVIRVQDNAEQNAQHPASAEANKKAICPKCVKISAYSLSPFPLSPSLFHPKTLHSRCPPLCRTIADHRMPPHASGSGAQPPKTAGAKTPPPYSPPAARKCGENLKCCSLSRSIPLPSSHLFTGELHRCVALAEENKAHPTSSLIVARNFPFRRHVLHRFLTFPGEQCHLEKPSSETSSSRRGLRSGVHLRSHLPTGCWSTGVDRRV
ncbi:hypothetical protein L484_001281 [Morus notabilis]|uniref:TF-B3 domain-containing protein n=1 Tax=Morus notabilis TaxID=981085 RepID=W9RZ15_9ROSA|nr:hypothetical protein L484_001281 [Morus notabilis]